MSKPIESRNSVPIHIFPDFERGWLTGLIDGEGTITIYQDRWRQGNPHLKPEIGVTNTNEELIEKARTVLSIYSPSVCKKKRRDEKRKDCYYLRITGQGKIASLLKNILPHLAVKRQVAEKVFEFCASRIKAMRYGGGGPPYSESEWCIYYGVMDLNRKRTPVQENGYNWGETEELKNRHPNSLTLFEKGWLTSLVDGEGYVGLVLSGGHPRPVVTVSNNSERLIEKIWLVLNPSYSPVICSGGIGVSLYRLEKISSLLRNLAPHLIVKKRVAEKVLQFCELRIEKLRSYHKFGPKPPHSEEEWELYREVRELNKRGRRSVL